MSVTEEDLKKLPLRAIVALLVRCVRRVRSFFPSGGSQNEAALDAALECAERFASGVPAAPRTPKMAAQTARTAGGVHAETHFATPIARTIAKAAATAAEIASATDFTFFASLADKYNDATKSAAVCLDDIELIFEGLGDPELRTATELDYKRLLELTERGHLELGLPIDLHEAGPLGPLWPDGEPEWYTKAKLEAEARVAREAQANDIDQEPPTIPPLDFLLDPGDATPEEIGTLFAEISKLNRMMGGPGIRFTVEDCRQPVRVKAMQP